MRLDTPFLLLDDARPGGAPARLYRSPVEVVSGSDVAQLRPALDRLRRARQDGLHAAGFLSYEAGTAFEPAAAMEPDRTTPLFWFGLFDGWEEVADVPALLPDPAGAWIGQVRPAITRDEYGTRFDAVQELIRAGDVYQANLTFRATATLIGDPLAAYAQLRARSRAGWGALIDTGTHRILSCSPELFFRLDGDRLLSRPMKGTARRGDEPEGDRRLATALASDNKQRAENLMIVDLMRNDLARVATPGSVAVPDLFRVETFPTVHQLVSDVTARLAPDKDALDVLAALFPCGSITGAPKVRAMQAIAELEGAPRGVYTGAIGRLDADGDAQFNVAIRTLSVPHGGTEATLGLGGGIVADSEAEAEWDEAAAKGAFIATPRAPDLIETMAFDPDQGLLLLDRHVSRIDQSAQAFGIPFNRHNARNELQAATFRLGNAARVRLLLAGSGAIAVEVGPAPVVAEMLTLAVVPLPVTPTDWRLRHKTGNRAFYDAARRAAGTDEVVFEGPDGFLTEGSFTSLFVEREGVLLTPPLHHGLLPGVLRADLLATGAAQEASLTRADLSAGVYMGNALRGLMPATVAVAKGSAAPL